MKPESIKRVTGPSSAAEIWRLERRIPLTFILAAAAQVLALIIWAVWLEARVAALEVEQPTLRNLSERFARIEERMDAVREELVRLRMKK
jgi:hypothetical protein